MRHRFRFLAAAFAALLGLAPTLHAQPTPNRVILTAVLANPGGTSPDAAGEWFEIYTALGTPSNLDGWLIQDSAASGLRLYHRIDSPLQIPGCGFVVLGNHANTRLNGGVTLDDSYGATLSLANSLGKICERRRPQPASPASRRGAPPRAPRRRRFRLPGQWGCIAPKCGL